MEKGNSKEKSTSLVDITHDLHKEIKAKEVVVFCGAGISIHSGLPSANNFVWKVLEKLDTSATESETVMASELPFEAFVETLHQSTEIGSLLDIFTFGEPNINHILLAKLVKLGYLKTICTTNFDQLIETALEREGLVAGRDFQVIYQEEYFDRIDWSDKRSRIIKLHGSIDDRDNMAIMLDQVASKTLSKKRQKIVDYIFSRGIHKNVLVIGYSCSDIFDISPQIEALQKEHKKILFADHRSALRNECEIENIIDKEHKNPFKRFIGSKRVYCNTDDFIKSIWKLTVEDEYSFREADFDEVLLNKCVDNWYLEAVEQYSKAINYSILGRLFFRISEFQKTVEFYEQSIEATKKPETINLTGGDLGNLGNAYYWLGDYRKALKSYNQGLLLSRKFGEKQWEASILGNLGLVYRTLEMYHKAIEHLKQALQILVDIDHKHGQGDCFCNLGNIYEALGEYQKAIEYQYQSLNITREIGDKHGEASSLFNLGNAY